MVAPDVKFPQGGQIGDPTSNFSTWLSNGPGGPGGSERAAATASVLPRALMSERASGIFRRAGWCDGAGSDLQSGTELFRRSAKVEASRNRVCCWSSSEQDGHTYDIRVAQSLGMGLDEKAIEAVNRWRFRPGTLNGQPVATQIAVQVDFRLY